MFKNYRLSRDMVTYDVNRDASTAYCQSSPGDKVDWFWVFLASKTCNRGHPRFRNFYSTVPS